MLHPAVVLRISEQILQGETPYARTRLAVEAALGELRRGADEQAYRLVPRGERWLDMMEMALEESIPETEEAMIEQQMPLVDSDRCDLREYGIG